MLNYMILHVNIYICVCVHVYHVFITDCKGDNAYSPSHYKSMSLQQMTHEGFKNIFDRSSPGQYLVK